MGTQVQVFIAPPRQEMQKECPQQYLSPIWQSPYRFCESSNDDFFASSAYLWGEKSCRTFPPSHQEMIIFYSFYAQMLSHPP